MSNNVIEGGGPIYVRVRDKLIEQISTMEKGSKLPSERELSKLFDVDRTSIRRALNDLQQEGFVTRYHGKGTYIHKHVMPGASSEADIKMVGLVVPGMEVSYYIHMIHGIEAEADNRGYSLVVCNSLYNQERERQLLDYISRQSIDRILVFPFFTDSIDPEYASLIQSITDRGIKVVLVDQRFYGLDVPSVTTDKTWTGYVATEHLIGLGHRRIAYASTESFGLAGRDHVRGYKMALKDNDIECAEDLIFDISPIKCAGPMQQAIVEKLTQDPKAFSAIATPYFSMAYGIIKAANQLGIRIPDDLALVGGECYENPDYSYLTYTRSPTTQVGAESMKMLLQDDYDQSMQRHKLVRADLVLGSTCGAMWRTK